MAIRLEDLIEDTFSDIQNITPNKMEQVIGETVRILTDLEEKIKSEDPEERKIALERAKEIKTAFEVQTKAICEKAGINPEQFADYAEQALRPPKPTQQASSKKLKPRIKG